MDIKDLAPLGLDPLLSIKELAAYLGIPEATLRDWRVDGKGPSSIRVGGQVRYAISDVRAWLEAHREPAAAEDPIRAR